jgi:hypothetical protein
VVAHSLPNTDPVHQITIIPHGMAGGFTMTLPKEDKYYGTKTEMQEEIVHLLGGRAAEKVTLDDISTGASNDIMRATDIARTLVTKYGFSDKLGLVNYSAADEVFLGKDFTTHKNYSEEIASEIDEEIKAIIDDAFATAVRILTEHSDILNTVAEALLEIETLDGEQFEALYSGGLTLEQLRQRIHDEAKDIRAKNEAEAAETELIMKEAELTETEDEDFYDDAYDEVLDGSDDLNDLDKLDDSGSSPIGPGDEPEIDRNGWVVDRPSPKPSPKPAAKKRRTAKAAEKDAPDEDGRALDDGPGGADGDGNAPAGAGEAGGAKKKRRKRDPGAEAADSGDVKSGDAPEAADSGDAKSGDAPETAGETAADAADSTGAEGATEDQATSGEAKKSVRKRARKTPKRID